MARNGTVRNADPPGDYAPKYSRFENKLCIVFCFKYFQQLLVRYNAVEDQQGSYVFWLHHIHPSQVGRWGTFQPQLSKYEVNYSSLFGTKEIDTAPTSGLWYLHYHRNLGNVAQALCSSASWPALG